MRPELGRLSGARGYGGGVSSELCWVLLYTKPRAEVWAEMRVRKLGFATLLPRSRQRTGFGAYFPRYIFAGYREDQTLEPLARTPGVVYVVHHGNTPALIPAEIVDRVRSRMDRRGLIEPDVAVAGAPLFASRQRDRVRALLQLVRPGVQVIA